MGNKCMAQSGAQYYQSINYERYKNPSDLNKKYQFKTKSYTMKPGIKTIQVYDMIFQKTRVMKQVSLFL